MNLRDSLTRNWPLKLTSLTLALLLWAMATAEEPGTATIPVRIAVQAPPGRTLLHPPEEVNAIVTGPRGDLFRVASEQLVIIRTLPDTTTRTAELEIGPNDVDLPPGVEVRVHDVYPRRLTLELDRVESRTVPVHPMLRVPADSALAVGTGLLVEPASVEITGPSELVRRTDTLRTLPIALDADGPVDQRVRLDTVGLGGLRVEPTVVTVTGAVRRSAERTIAGVPVHMPSELAAEFVPSEPRVSVVVRGESPLVAALTADSLVVAVASDRRAADRAALRVVAPAGIAAAAHPDSVTLVPRAQ